MRRPTVSRSGQAEQLGVGELAARAEVLAVVVDHVEPGVLQLAVEPLGELVLVAAGLAEADEVDVERRDRARPRDALLVGELLDRCAVMRAGPMP